MNAGVGGARAAESVITKRGAAERCYRLSPPAWFSAAAVNRLPAEQHAVGGAVNPATRQIGAVLGVAVTVLLLGGAALQRADFRPLDGLHAALVQATALLCLPIDTRPGATALRRSSRIVRSEQSTMTESVTPHPLDDALRLEALGADTFRGRTTPPYANMVGPFGGATAACLLQAPLQHPARLGEPVALTVNFAAPLADGEFEITARAARTNRSNQHWTIELRQGDETAATATAVFAARRETWSLAEAVPPTGLPPAASMARTPPAARLAWPHRYDMRFVRGGLPAAFDEQLQPDSISELWVRDEPPRPLDFPALAAICDSFFPRVMLRRRKFVPIGTVSLTTYFHADAAMLREQDTRHVLGVARGLNFRNGYFDQSAEVWGDTGRLLATSHQIVYYRA